MSCLRRLALSLEYLPTRYSDSNLPPLASAGDVVPLSRLTHLIFRGHTLYLHALVVGLTAPSLQHLDADLCGQALRFFPILRLCKVICDTEWQFTAVRSGLSHSTLRFRAGAISLSVDDQPLE